MFFFIWIMNGWAIGLASMNHDMFEDDSPSGHMAFCSFLWPIIAIAVTVIYYVEVIAPKLDKFLCEITGRK